MGIAELGPEDDVFDRYNVPEPWYVYGSGGNDTIRTSIREDYLYGGPGNDVLNGTSPNDRLFGGPGDDTYFVYAFSDGSLTIVDEISYGGDGRDTIISQGSFSLKDPRAIITGAIENLTISTNSYEADAIGNELDNVITGNQHDGRLDGLEGNDLLIGGAGRDVFVFRTSPNSITNVDRIADFSHKDDRFVLDEEIFTKIKGKKHEWILDKKYFHKGSEAQDRNDRLIYDKNSGEVIYDANGARKGKAIVFAVLDNSPDNINRKDFNVQEIDFY